MWLYVFVYMLKMIIIFNLLNFLQAKGGDAVIQNYYIIVIMIDICMNLLFKLPVTGNI